MRMKHMVRLPHDRDPILLKYPELRAESQIVLVPRAEPDAP